MIWCEDCNRAFEKITLGVIVKISPYSYSVACGDRYVCQGCGKTVIGDFGTPYNPGRDD